MASIGTLTGFTFTNLHSAVDGDRDQSAGVDFGASPPDALIITAQVTPVAGSGDAAGYVDFYLAEGAEGTTTNLSGGASGSDATYAPTGEAQQIKNPRYIGRMDVDGTTTDSFEKTFVLPGPIARYGSIISENQIGEALHASANFVKYQAVDY